MTLETIKIPQHFYLYCALMYADNRTVGYNEVVEDLRNKVVEILVSRGIPKINMPKHSYHYLMGLLNTQGYYDNETFMKADIEMLNYVSKLAKIPELQKLQTSYEEDLNKRLGEYKERFSDIENFFESHFDFQPKIHKYFITRNWDTSGKCLLCEDAYYILVGWKIQGINLKQIIHEIMHSYIRECKLLIPKDIKEYMQKIPTHVFEDYAKPNILIEESFVRALVVYVSGIDNNITGYTFSEDDKSMMLPQLYLDILEKNKQSILTKEYLNNIAL